MVLVAGCINAFRYCRYILSLHRPIGGNAMTSATFVSLAFFMFCAAQAMSASQVTAQPPSPLKLGVRADAPPFSEEIGGQPKGYSVDLCLHIAEAVSKQMDQYHGFEFVWVSPADRFEKLARGEIDMLCESTTVTLQRLRLVDFSVHTFVSGASYLFRADRGDVQLRDLQTKIVSVTENTTTEELVRKELPDADIQTVESAHQGIDLLGQGAIDAYFGDREVLLQLRNDATKLDPPIILKAAKRYLSFEPYALGVRPDPADVPCERRRELLFHVNMALAQLVRSGGIKQIFRDNFPGQVESEVLQQMLEFQSLPEGEPLDGLCAARSDADNPQAPLPQ